MVVHGHSGIVLKQATFGLTTHARFVIFASKARHMLTPSRTDGRKS